MEAHKDGGGRPVRKRHITDAVFCWGDARLCCTFAHASQFDTDVAPRKLNGILKSADKAAALTRRLLAFSRKQVLQLRVLDLNALVAQVNELLPPVMGDDIELILDLAPDLGHVKADAAQMEQAIVISRI